MRELIYKDEAYKAIDNCIQDSWYRISPSEAKMNIRYLVSDANEADRPQGEWIVHFDDIWPEESTIECSVCHEEQPLEIDDNFCPNCGAKMKGSRR